MKAKILLVTLLLLISSASLNSQTIMNIYQNNGTVVQIPLNSIDSITYTINDPGVFATITTNAISLITDNTAVAGGNITNDGGTTVTQRGICYDTTISPTTANSIVISGNGIGSYNCNLSGLLANTNYYVRAFAINSAGTVYGDELSFTTTNGGGSISSPGAGVTFDGYTYSSIVLGNGQEWMAENLRTTIYANGDTIPNVTDSTQWSTLTTGAWAHYENDSQYENPRGKLYNWFTMVDPRNACPTGWHIPTDDEWSSLINYLDSNALGGDYSINIAGSKMKSTGNQYWQLPNTDATNESGFSGQPGGFRSDTGSFGALIEGASWWCSTEYLDNTFACVRQLSYNESGAVRAGNPKLGGNSARCLKD